VRGVAGGDMLCTLVHGACVARRADRLRGRPSSPRSSNRARGAGIPPVRGRSAAIGRVHAVPAGRWHAAAPEVRCAPAYVRPGSGDRARAIRLVPRENARRTLRAVQGVKSPTLSQWGRALGSRGVEEVRSPLGISGSPPLHSRAAREGAAQLASSLRRCFGRSAAAEPSTPPDSTGETSRIG
jgi:hypothetical protein